MDKKDMPVSMLIQQFESQIVNTINNCSLHPSIVELTMRNIYAQIKEAAQNQINAEVKQYQEAQSEENNATEE